MTVKTKDGTVWTVISAEDLFELIDVYMGDEAGDAIRHLFENADADDVQWRD